MGCRLNQSITSHMLLTRLSRSLLVSVRSHCLETWLYGRSSNLHTTRDISWLKKKTPSWFGLQNVSEEGKVAGWLLQKSWLPMLVVEILNLKAGLQGAVLLAKSGTGKGLFGKTLRRRKCRSAWTFQSKWMLPDSVFLCCTQCLQLCMSYPVYAVLPLKHHDCWKLQYRKASSKVLMMTGNAKLQFPAAHAMFLFFKLLRLTLALHPLYHWFSGLCLLH